MTEPLRLFVDPDSKILGLHHIPLFYSLWGVPEKKKSLYDIPLMRHTWDTSCFTFVDVPEEAEFVLLPYDYWQLKRSHPELLAIYTKIAHAAQKPLLIDASGDAAGVVDVPGALVLRINQYRFELPEYEVTVPVPCEDLLESYYETTLQLRQKSETPSVGFVGWGAMSVKQYVRSFIKEIPVRIRGIFDTRYRAKQKGVFWRERAVRVFQKSSRLVTSFIIRSSYSGHVQTVVGDSSKNRREFVENIFNTDYTLIVRGDANAATRFYEALSLGRIPVFIDTACVLPLEHLVDYREFCVFIDFKDIDQAPDILADFHARLSEKEFIAMQQRARYVFERYLRYDSFTPYLVSLLRSRVESPL